MENAHPHQAGRVTLIHNGIIENYHQLTEEFCLEGKLKSQTDSEVAAWVLDSLYEGDPLEAIKNLVHRLEEMCIRDSSTALTRRIRPWEVFTFIASLTSTRPLKLSRRPVAKIIPTPTEVTPSPPI